MAGSILPLTVLGIAQARTILCDTETHLLSHDQHSRERRGAYILSKRFDDWKDVQYYITRGTGDNMNNVDNFSFQKCKGSAQEGTMINNVATAIRYIERNTNVRFRQTRLMMFATA